MKTNSESHVTENDQKISIKISDLFEEQDFSFKHIYDSIEKWFIDHQKKVQWSDFILQIEEKHAQSSIEQFKNAIAKLNIPFEKTVEIVIDEGFLTLYDKDLVAFYVINLQDINDTWHSIERDYDQWKIQAIEAEINDILDAISLINSNHDEREKWIFWKWIEHNAQLDHSNAWKVLHFFWYEDDKDSFLWETLNFFWYNSEEQRLVQKFNSDGKQISLKDLQIRLNSAQRELLNRQHVTKDTSIWLRTLQRIIQVTNGLDDMHEDNVWYFNLSEEEIKFEVQLVLNNMSINQSLDLLVDKCKQAEGNWWTSDIAKNGISKFFNEYREQLYKKILKIKDHKKRKKYSYELALISYGRDREWNDLDLESFLTDSFFRDKILNQLMFNNKNWLASSIMNNIEDEKATKQLPVQLVINCIEKLNQIIKPVKPKTNWRKWKIENQLDEWELYWKELLIQSWHGKLIDRLYNIDPHTTYHTLSPEEKVSLSVIVRITEKLDWGWKEYFEWYDKWAHEWKIQLNGADQNDKNFYDLFGHLFKNLYVTPWELKDKVLMSSFLTQVADEWAEKLQNLINSELDIGNDSWWLTAKDAEDFKLEWIDAQIFDYYQNTHWNGWLNPSDKSWEYAEIWWTIVTSIWASILLAMWWAAILGWAIASWATMWAITISKSTLVGLIKTWIIVVSGTAIDTVVSRRWHESNINALVDIWTNFVVNTAFWLSWFWWTQYYISKIWASNQTFIISTAVETGPAWFAPEISRAWEVEEYEQMGAKWKNESLWLRPEDRTQKASDENLISQM